MARRRQDDDPEFDDEFQSDPDEDSEGDPFVDGDDDTAFCPECGAEIHDSADVCPKCFTWLDGETSRHRPAVGKARDRLKRFVVWTLVGLLLLGLAFMLLGRLMR